MENHTEHSEIESKKQSIVVSILVVAVTVVAIGSFYLIENLNSSEDQVAQDFESPGDPIESDGTILLDDEGLPIFDEPQDQSPDQIDQKVDPNGAESNRNNSSNENSQE